LTSKQNKRSFLLYFFQFIYIDKGLSYNGYRINRHMHENRNNNPLGPNIKESKYHPHKHINKNMNEFHMGGREQKGRKNSGKEKVHFCIENTKKYFSENQLF